MILFKFLFNVLVPLYFIGILLFGFIRLRMIIQGDETYSWNAFFNVLAWPILLTIPSQRNQLFKANLKNEGDN